MLVDHTCSPAPATSIYGRSASQVSCDERVKSCWTRGKCVATGLREQAARCLLGPFPPMAYAVCNNALKAGPGPPPDGILQRAGWALRPQRPPLRSRPCSRGSPSRSACPVVGMGLPPGGGPTLVNTAARPRFGSEASSCRGSSWRPVAGDTTAGGGPHGRTGRWKDGRRPAC